jgi:hypothetical protein
MACAGVANSALKRSGALEPRTVPLADVPSVEPCLDVVCQSLVLASRSLTMTERAIATARALVRTHIGRVTTPASADLVVHTVELSASRAGRTAPATPRARNSFTNSFTRKHLRCTEFALPARASDRHPRGRAWPRCKPEHRTIRNHPPRQHPPLVPRLCRFANQHFEQRGVRRCQPIPIT